MDQRLAKKSSTATSKTPLLWQQEVAENAMEANQRRSCGSRKRHRGRRRRRRRNIHPGVTGHRSANLLFVAAHRALLLDELVALGLVALFTTLPPVTVA